MATKSRRISNNAGSANSFLNAVKENDTAAKYASAAEVDASDLSHKHQKLVKSILNAVKQGFADSNEYSKKLDSKSIDVTLGRIATLLDEFKKDFVDTELTDIKEEIIDEISGISTSAILKSFISSQISKLFDDTATKSDIEELKDWISANTIVDNSSFSKEEKDLRNDQLESDDANIFKNKEVESLEDQKDNGYQDSTIAKNFSTLQSYVGSQIETLNDNLKNIPGQAGILSKIGLAVATPFKAIGGVLSKLTKGIATITRKTVSVATEIAKAPFKMIGFGIAKLTKGIAGIGSSIIGLGSKISGVVASPFKAIGGFFSKLNPFKRSPKEEKKQKLRDKMMDIMSKVMDKLWSAIEPFIDKVAMFMGLVSKFVIVPIALIAIKVALIVAAIVALGVFAYIAYKWITNNVKWLLEYITGGELWEDIKAGMMKAWEWMKDFGKWLWPKLVEFGKWYLNILLRWWKFLLVDIPLWIWDKLCEFGSWFYDNYIYKYIVQPFKEYVWEPLKALWNDKVWPTIEPFVQSLTELKNNIVKAFSAWDTNKSIWENLKNIGGIIKDSIAEWWENSPFKKLWDDKVWPTIEPFIISITELKDKIVKAFEGWDANKSIWENLKNIGGILRDAIAEWWNDDNNPIRAMYTKYIQPIIDKIKDFGNTIANGIREWWQQSSLKAWIDEITSKMQYLKEKIGNAIWDLGICFIRPFGFLVGKPMSLSSEEKDAYKQQQEIDKKLEKIAGDRKDVDEDIAKLEARIQSGDYAKEGSWFGKTKADLEKDLADKKAKQQSLKQQASDLAAQQVQQAAKPIQQIEAMQQEGNAELQKTGQEMSNDIAKKEQQQKQFDMAQSDKSDDIRNEIKAFREDYNKNANDPAVAPVYVPYYEQMNPAMMHVN